MLACTRNGAICFNSENHENEISIASSVLEWHLCFSREVNLLWRALNVELREASFACKAGWTTWASPWNHSTQANRQWNEGHSAETTEQMLPWYTFTMVHLILSKPLWQKRDRHASAYVPIYFFLFFPMLWEGFNWQIQDSPSNHPWTFRFFESLKGSPFLQGILSSSNKLSGLQKTSF